MPKHDFDFLIVGQGLAGSILAYYLIKSDFRVLVVDNHHQGSASKVAAGIINPITGHRLNLTKDFEHYYPRATQLYHHLEQDLNVELLQSIKQQRLIKNQGQLEYFLKRKQQPNYRSFLGELELSGLDFRFNRHGSINIKQTALVNTSQLLEKVKQWLIDRSSFIDGQLDYQTLSGSDNSFTISGKTSSHVVFCEGYQALNNPWLEHLPFKLAKGEVLTIETTSTLTDKMLNWSSWLLPVSNASESGLAKLGSNYDWNDLNLKTNPQTTLKLLDSLQKFTHHEAQLVHSDVGIRPTTTQRQPFIGPLRNLKNAYCFNGFGSKGCLLIPYYAQLLSDHLGSLQSSTAAPLPAYLTKWV